MGMHSYDLGMNHLGDMVGQLQIILLSVSVSMIAVSPKANGRPTTKENYLYI